MDSPSESLTRSQLLRQQEPESALQREFEVLIKGGAEGIGRGASRSAGELGQFSRDFLAKPFDTSADYVKKHWHEAAIGAGVAILAPRKYLSLALVAASGRGLAQASWDGAISALDPKQNLHEVKNRFASNIAAETNLLVNSLPATIAGGFAGRSLANAAFGKNLGLYDLASGKITSSEVGANLLAAKDKLFPPKAKLAVFDLDGTLVSSNKHLALAIEAGNKHLAQASGLPEPLVNQLLTEQFSKLKSFSNPWTVELALAEKLQVGKAGSMSYADFKSKLSDPYWKIFEETVPKNLNVYDGIRPALEQLAKENVKAIVFTNSAGFGALPRLRLTDLEKSFAKTIMLDNVKPPQGLAPELIKHGQDRLNTTMSGNPAVSIIDRGLAKPNPEFLLQTIKEAGLRPSQVLMIGDSLGTDMLVAQRSGARGFWSRWHEKDAAFDALLDKVSGGNFPTPTKASVPFELELNSPAQILSNLRSKPDISGLLKSSLQRPPLLLPLQSWGYGQRPEN